MMSATWSKCRPTAANALSPTWTPTPKSRIPRRNPIAGPQSTPLLWLIVGPNGAGKSTYYARVVYPHLKAPFVNADLIARDKWPHSYQNHAYEAARLAARTRARLIATRKSFVAETVFSHSSKIELIEAARAAGYVIWMTFVCVSTPALSVARVGQRMREGGHPVPPEKIRSRYENLRANVLACVPLIDRLAVVDNSEKGRALRDVLLIERGQVVWRNKSRPAWVDEMFPQASG